MLHQLGAVVWVGGLLHLVGFALLWRRAGGPAAEPLGVRVLARFSAVAIAGAGPGAGARPLPVLSYVGGWGGLIGTGYGVMVLTKVALLGCALVLGGLNFLILRRGDAGAGAIAARVPAFIEAEVGLGLTLLLAAASLTSLPPSVDVVADRATPAEVAARFRPAMPRLSSPARRAAPGRGRARSTTPWPQRQPEEYAWSEYNHHTAGFFVFAMGLLALLDRTGRARWARHWPLGFLGLAAFLFVRNDPRAWPLGPAGFWESMVLPDVLQHRLVVLLVVALAVFEWMVRVGAAHAARRAPGLPAALRVGRRAAPDALARHVQSQDRVPRRGLARAHGAARRGHGLGPLARGAAARRRRAASPAGSGPRA